MFTQIFVNYVQTCGKTAYQIAKDTGISQGTMNEYKNGKKLPTMQNLVKIANALDCSVDYLLGRTDNPKSHKIHSNDNESCINNSDALRLDEHQKLLIELYNNLSPIEQIELISNLSKVSKKNKSDST